jgi:hypothetical protein
MDKPLSRIFANYLQDYKGFLNVNTEAVIKIIFGFCAGLVCDRGSRDGPWHVVMLSVNS